MNTTGYLPWSVWESALRFWPVAIIGLGLQIASGKKIPGLAIAVVVMMILAAMNPYTGEWIRSEGQREWAVDLKDATSKLELNLEAPSLELDASGDPKLNAGKPGLALTAGLEWDDTEPQTRAESGGATTKAYISAPSTGSSNSKQYWDLSLNPSLATTLKVNAAVSVIRANMASVYLDSMDISSGVAKLDLSMGLSGRETNINVSGGVATVTLTVPSAVGLKIHLTGPLTVSSDFAAQGLTKSGDVWVTQGFDAATTKVTLSVSSGAGKIDVKR